MRHAGAAQGRFHWVPIAVLVLVTGLAFILDKSLHSQKPVPPPPGWQVIRPPHEVSALFIHGNTVWAGGTGGVTEIDRQSGAVVNELKASEPFSYVRALLVDRNGILWIGHERGVTAYDGKSFKGYTKKNGLPDDRVNAIYEDREGRIWVGTWQGAAVLENNSWRVINKAGGLLDDMVNVILEDSDGGIWFGSYVAPSGGISYLKYGKWQYFSTDNGLPHNNISTLFLDNNGMLWAGTGLLDRGGAAVLAKGLSGWHISRTMGKKDGLAGEKVRSVFQDDRGAYWLGSEYDGVAVMRDGQIRILTEKDGLSCPEVKIICQDEDGDLWLGTRDGITRISRKALP